MEYADTAMNAFDESCQGATRFDIRGLTLAVLTGLAAIWTPAAQADPVIDAVEWLERADMAREQALAVADPYAKAAAFTAGIEMLNRADGRTFLPGGEIAPVDYDGRLAEAMRAVRAAGSPEDLLDRLAALPGSERGSEGGRKRMLVSNTGPVRVVFQARTPAIIYARTQMPAMLRLVVRDDAGRTLCDERRASGRVLCRWHPQDRQVVQVEAISLDRNPGPVNIFTN